MIAPGDDGGALVPVGPAGGAGVGGAGSLAPRFLFPRMLADRRGLGSGLTLREYVDVYATSRPIGDETIRQYRVAVGVFEEWAGDGVRLDELSELMLGHFLRHYETVVSPATARSKRNMLLSLWRAAAAEYLCEPPTRAVRASRVPWSPRECWTREEVLKLLRAASWARGGHVCGLRRSEWWNLAIRVAWDTGLRWGDQMALRVDTIADGIAVIRQRKTATPVAIRLHEGTRLLLRSSLEAAPRELVTPWTASRRSFDKQLAVIVTRAGISPGTWRFLRRGSASNVEGLCPGRGMAARHLGHAPGSKVTELNYLSPKVVARAAPAVMPDEL